MALRRTFLIGSASAGVGLGLWNSRNPSVEAVQPGAFSQSEWRSFKLEQVTPMTHDTKRFRFTIPDEDATRLPVASCISVRQPGTDLARPYTPTTMGSAAGYFDLVVKKYPTGKMGGYIHGMEPGDAIEVMGPWMKWEYKEGKQESIGMIAGGSGITPMFQVIQEILSNEDDNTKLSLLAANVSDHDILLRKELNALEDANRRRFNVSYVCDKGHHWRGFQGHINADMIKKTLPDKDSNTVTLVCGPPGMMKHVCGAPVWKDNKMLQGPLEGVLKDMGYTSDKVQKF